MVSVVVRTKNEEKHIGYCIQSLTDFIGKPEIVIVDNESTDNTIPIINRFEYHNIKKITIPKNDYTPGKSLNLGLKNCTEDYVMILSAHCEIVQFAFIPPSTSMSTSKFFSIIKFLISLILLSIVGI